MKVSAFYLDKQKSFIPKEKKISRCQYQNKKAMFTDPIFSDGFAFQLMQGCTQSSTYLIREILGQKICKLGLVIYEQVNI